MPEFLSRKVAILFPEILAGKTFFWRFEFSVNPTKGISTSKPSQAFKNFDSSTPEEEKTFLSPALSS
jgi:hypothetical protein